ncbi:MAG: hypothetical protein DIZ80_11530 [endosymbiont of Galathealinum brachiosum]|uniref:DUF4124 domain-containing protein n=1 Tax=endosymbiont of Galathealinum brachiosum TaxID=2200906 RepID=A0A370DD99_9GAMM|nr:MAG: hypothetical protein DIZ80_11530 [endosymbiont of Galathealinum brachiosum]
MNLNKTDSFYKILLGCILITSPVSLFANSPVKSVDSAGNVTYSDKPVAGAQAVTKVPIKAGPSASEIDAAQQQARKNINQAEKIDLTPEPKAKKQAPNKTASEEDRPVINAGGSNRKYGTKPVPRPPINRPGINPPPSNMPARPRAGGRR